MNNRQLEFYRKIRQEIEEEFERGIWIMIDKQDFTNNLAVDLINLI